MRKEWRTTAVPGILLQQTLQKLTDEGYEVEYVFEHGIMPVQATNVIKGPNVTEMTPLFTIIAWTRKHSSAN